MTCYIVTLKDGSRAFLCGKFGPHCADCMGVGDNLCDYPVGENKTCDRSICDLHSYEVAPNLHYCPAHFKEWNAFRESGGVKKQLENVIPFKR